MDLDWCTLNHELLSELQYAQVGAVFQRTGEGSITKLDVHQLKNMRDAMTREIQSWLKYHAVKAALRSQFAAKDVMQMRWILRFKDSGQAKSRVIIGCHDPRIGGEVRVEHWCSAVEAFLQGQGTGQDVELVEAVAALAEHLHRSEEQVVLSTKCCYGRIDAPRRWWLTLQHDLTQQVWRSCGNRA